MRRASETGGDSDAVSSWTAHYKSGRWIVWGARSPETGGLPGNFYFCKIGNSADILIFQHLKTESIRSHLPLINVKIFMEKSNRGLWQFWTFLCKNLLLYNMDYGNKEKTVCIYIMTSLLSNFWKVQLKTGHFASGTDK